jgi:peptidoglycan/xylan/chitin deacetylase (PgdA/CDA1 family)
VAFPAPVCFSGIMIKGVVKKALIGSGALRWLAHRRGKSAAILMYHSVLEEPSRVTDSLGGIVLSTRTFQSQIEMLARDFRPIDLEQAGRFVTEEGELPERAVVITFDDGYTDNYEIAMPILNRVGVPATFYVTVDCIERRTLPWPSRLRFAFRTTQKKSWVDSTGKSWNLSSAEDREKAYLSACDQVCQMAGVTLEAEVARAERELQAKLPDSTAQFMMTWDQVKGLEQKGHIVGSHTMTHPNMAFLKLDDLRRELTVSKQTMESHLGAPVRHFSYPCPALFPNWTQQTTEESKRAGYQTAVTTNDGVVRKRDNPLELKRVRPTRTVAGLRWNLERAFAGSA